LFSNERVSPQGAPFLYSCVGMSQMSFNKTEVHADAVIIGMGASSCLLLLAMDRRGWLRGKRVVVIEPLLQQLPQKTFCFWSSDKDSIQRDLKEIISDSWSHCEVMRGQSLSMSPYQYHGVESSVLWQHTRSVGNNNGVVFIEGLVDAIDEEGDKKKVHTAIDIFCSDYIFDSRPPSFASNDAGFYHIHQSFVGWFVRPKTAHFISDTFRLMDFEIPQNGQCQFMYVLPFLDGRILVEFTRFGKQKIEQQEAQEMLEAYIGEHFGDVEMVASEHGCIPMSNARLELSGPKLTIPIGTRAGLLKPSSGYAFRKMYDHAERCLDELEKECPKAFVSETSTGPKSASRFAWYDQLLLHILSHDPQQGKGIFQTLFSKVALPDTFQFLDEKTSIWQEMKIFSRLPKIPFLRAAWAGCSYSKMFHPLSLLILSSVLVVMGYSTFMQNIFGYSLLALGMVAIGMPHGAVDHLLDGGNGLKSRAIFIGQYLMLMCMMGVLWYFVPALSLFFFIVFSGWHFGSGDGYVWGLKSSLSWLWGCSVLLYLFTTHSVETTSILSQMNISFEVSSHYSWILFPWLLLALFKRNLAWMFTIAMLWVSSFLPLVFAFGLYFVGQHSWVGWQYLKLKLNKNSMQIWWNAFPFHLGAWLLLGATFFFHMELSSWSEYSAWGLFFIFLSCVSFPHVWMTHRSFAK